MQLTEHSPGDHHFIRSVTSHDVVVDDQSHTRSLIVAAQWIEPHWPVTQLSDLGPTTIEPLLRHQPELVLVGVGTTQAFPEPAVMAEFLKRGIGLECMTLQAACRTFNVVMSEQRRALAALILPPQS